ncbi:MAG: VCBS repeat-containing protein, partial [Calditrichaeota bacterium]|nr:VCBS repeat-containing protein [Calditrichota bacterium]
LSILFGSGDGSFYKTDTLTITQQRAAGVVIGYLDNDNHLDLAVTTQNNSRLLILSGNGDGTFANPVEYITSGNPYGLQLGDYDNDLDLDIAVTNGGGNSFYVHYNDGMGDFSNKVLQPAPNGPPTFLVKGFINNDNFLDLASAKGGKTTNTLDILINDQSGNFSTDTAVTTGK